MVIRNVLHVQNLFTVLNELTIEAHIGKIKHASR